MPIVLTERQRSILHRAVREYIRTGSPVGSENFVAQTHAPYSPATVRSEFAALERGGYLTHPYPSAGRLPTAAGYRSYVDEGIAVRPDAALTDSLRRLTYRPWAADVPGLLRTLAHLLAQATGTLAVVASSEALLHEAGMPYLFRFPELTDRETARELGELLEALEEHFHRASTLGEEGPTVFIDGENPLRRVRRTSMVLSAPRFRETTIVAALFGPLRMPYERILRVLHALEVLAATDD